MLDTITKKRIDDCRDILVGKLPDPKAQIEQITIGLIYKFMDDMDKEAIELGGKAKFFSNYTVPDPEFPNDPKKNKEVNFKKYSWDNLFNAKVTATEMLTLYSDAIMGMDKNPNIPQLFRDIFKNAYLPYRDPETLKLFLKTINEFEYTHSEKLGDAFEYLLSVMGSQGDAGQFRTPRHIIDFLVAVVAPEKTDTIMDPACGTAGFLISAYNHIRLKNTKENKQDLNIYEYNKFDKKPFNNIGDKLTPDERKKMIQNFVGYDISPDMVRLSLVNLYLHGFSDPHIWEYDTLSSEERWNENFDVILANPPFMSPKGGIRPHKKFSISSTRSEVLFVDYIAEHLNPKGRAGIIVPEGVIFQSGIAYKDIRKMLVEKYLYAVVSLPAGVFNPYSGVKTSILLMDKTFAKKSNEILFVKIDNDGYNLGAQRGAIKGSQLDEAIDLLRQFKDGEFAGSEMAHVVLKTEIAKNGDYNFSGERYKQSFAISSDYDFFTLAEVCEINPETIIPESLNVDAFNYLDISSVENGTGKVTLNNLIKTSEAPSRARRKIQNKDIALSTVRPNLKAFCYIENPPQFTIASTGFAILRAKKMLNSKFLFYNLFTDEVVNQMVSMMGKGAYPSINQTDVSAIKIPLPPLSIQKEIVVEIDGYQKIIDGAKMVVQNYKPKIDVDPEWEMVQLDTICESISDGDHMPPPKSEKGVPFITISNVSINNGIDFCNTYHVPHKYYHEIKFQRKPMLGDILYTVTGSFGIPILIDFEKEFCFQRHIGLIRPGSKVLNRYLYYYLMSPEAFSQATASATGVAQKTVSLKSLRSFIIPLPLIETQHEIVAKIEKELELINSSKQLIEIFEQKIKDRIAKVWGN